MPSRSHRPARTLMLPPTKHTNTQTKRKRKRTRKSRPACKNSTNIQQRLPSLQKSERRLPPSRHLRRLHPKRLSSMSQSHLRPVPHPLQLTLGPWSTDSVAPYDMMHPIIRYDKPRRTCAKMLVRAGLRCRCHFRLLADCPSRHGTTQAT